MSWSFSDKLDKKRRVNSGLESRPRSPLMTRELDPTGYVEVEELEKVKKKLAKAQKTLKRQEEELTRYERKKDNTIAYLELKLDSLSKPFLPGLPKQDRNILSERTLHYYVCEDLKRVRVDLTELIKRYTGTMRRTPSEETLTEILAWQLGKEGVGLGVSLTTKPVESKEGHDLVLQLLGPRTEEPLWICYLQAKKLNEERVAGFGYRFNQYAKNKGSLDKLLDELDVFRYGWFQANEELRTRYSQEEGEEKQYVQELLEKYDKEQCEKFTEYIEKIKKHEDHGGAQVELLYNKINEEQVARKKSHPRRTVTGGYIIYATDGVFYVPMEDVCWAFEHASQTLEKEKGKLPGAGIVSTAISEILFQPGRHVASLEEMIPTADALQLKGHF